MTKFKTNKMASPPFFTAHATYLFLAVQQDLDDLLRLGVHFEDGFQDTKQVQLGFHQTLGFDGC